MSLSWPAPRSPGSRCRRNSRLKCNGHSPRPAESAAGIPTAATMFVIGATETAESPRWIEELPVNRRLRSLVFGIALCSAAVCALGAAPGEPAPAFALPTADGRTIALDELRGQGRLRRLLGVVVRPLPPVVSVDERDAAEVRRARLRGRRDQRRQEARATPSVSSRRYPAKFTIVSRRGGRDAAPRTA